MTKTINDAKYWQMSVEETAKALETNIESGLSVKEVGVRLDLFGRNTFETSKKSSRVKIFLSQLKSPLILVLIIAGIVTLVISDYRDAVFIFVAVITLFLVISNDELMSVRGE